MRSAGRLKIAILLHFLRIEPRVVRKSCDRHLKIAIYHSFWRPNLISINFSFWRSTLISCERVATDTWKSQFYHSFCRISCERVAPDPRKSSFCRSTLISCERVATDTWKSQFYTTISDDRTLFRVNAWRWTLEIRNFTSAFEDRTSFRAIGLHFVAPRWHCPAP